MLESLIDCEHATKLHRLAQVSEGRERAGCPVLLLPSSAILRSSRPRMRFMIYQNHFVLVVPLHCHKYSHYDIRAKHDAFVHSPCERREGGHIVWCSY